MSIYSTNRAGTVASIDVVANESYRASDIGRIMYEAQLNDMAIFEATLRADFAEISGIREGTMLESELVAFNEANAKSLLENIKKALKNFWEKIKGVFKSAIQKIAAYVLRDGKAYAAEFRAFKKSKNAKPFGGEIKDAKYGFKSDAVAFSRDRAEYKEAIEGKKSEEIDKTALFNDVIKEILGEAVERKDIRAKVVEKCITGGDINASNWDSVSEELCKFISSNDAIKGLNKDKADCDKILSDIHNELTLVEKTIEDHGHNKNAEGLAATLKNISAAVSVYQDVIGTITSCKIAAAKNALSNARSILAKIKAGMHNGKVEGAVAEAAIADAEEEVATELDDDLATPVDDDTQAQIDELVAEA